ncbi:MAG: methyltransferase domain-containing protein [bacterium]
MRRSERREKMDTDECNRKELQGALRALDRTHALLGTLNSLVDTIETEIDSLDREPVSVLDLGAGSGYLGELLDEQLNSEIQYIRLDRSRDILSLSSNRRFADVVAELSKPPIDSGCADIVVSTLLLHHLPAENLVPFLVDSKSWSRHLTLHHDLVRSRLHHAVTWFFTRLTSTNNTYHHDGPLSVRKSLTKDEWVKLLRYPELGAYETSYHWPYRVLLTARNT